MFKISLLLLYACPPSSVLKKEFSELKEYPPTKYYYLERTAAKVLLTPDVTQMWLDHLHTVLLNQRGVRKAAATRQAKKLARATVLHVQPTTITTTSEYHCGQCAKYQEETEKEELWIGCDVCDKWYCGSCEGLLLPPVIDVYICTKCR